MFSLKSYNMSHIIWRHCTYKRLDSISTWHYYSTYQSQPQSLWTNHKRTWFWPITFQRARLRPTLVYINSTRISLHFAHMAATTHMSQKESSALYHIVQNHSYVIMNDKSSHIRCNPYSYLHSTPQYLSSGLKCTKSQVKTTLHQALLFHKFAISK